MATDVMDSAAVLRKKAAKAAAKEKKAAEKAADEYAYTEMYKNIVK